MLFRNSGITRETTRVIAAFVGTNLKNQTYSLIYCYCDGMTSSDGIKPFRLLEETSRIYVFSDFLSWTVVFMIRRLKGTPGFFRKKLKMQKKTKKIAKTCKNLQKPAKSIYKLFLVFLYLSL